MKNVEVKVVYMNGDVDYMMLFDINDMNDIMEIHSNETGEIIYMDGVFENGWKLWFYNGGC